MALVISRRRPYRDPTTFQGGSKWVESTSCRLGWWPRSSSRHPQQLSKVRANQRQVDRRTGGGPPRVSVSVKNEETGATRDCGSGRHYSRRSSRRAGIRHRQAGRFQTWRAASCCSSAPRDDQPRARRRRYRGERHVPGNRRWSTRPAPPSAAMSAPPSSASCRR